MKLKHEIKYLNEYAFADCSLLNNVTIPSSLTIINEYTFKGCSSLTSISIPSSVIIIGRNFSFLFLNDVSK